MKNFTDRIEAIKLRKFLIKCAKRIIRRLRNMSLKMGLNYHDRLRKQTRATLSLFATIHIDAKK